ncbi:hypothetical protein [Sandarakinorhabdus sp.]|uniref:hypothetical protein n=1 Tax=Sandarakinorhabdus sp. TaxID=1916663 RepID=UPI00286E9DDB|nr:hypothetical protein [Sandarakinorhabdus sp.]
MAAAARRVRPVPQGEIEVSAELVRIAEVLERMEEKIDTIEINQGVQGKQIERWRTVGSLVGPALFGLGAWVMTWADDAVLWFMTAVKS